MNRTLRRALVIATMAAAALAGSAPAMADHLEVEATVPDDVAVGEIFEVRVVVRSAETGRRVAGADVVALRDATIAGVSGEVELARGTTDRNGVATVRWQQRAAGTHTLVVDYTGPGEHEFETATLDVLTVGSGAQVVRSTSGVEIPGFGAWVLVAVLLSVWGLIQFALIGPMAVAREGLRAASDDEDEPEEAP
jgi:hypothetical protein